MRRKSGRLPVWTVGVAGWLAMCLAASGPGLAQEASPAAEPAAPPVEFQRGRAGHGSHRAGRQRQERSHLLIQPGEAGRRIVRGRGTIVRGERAVGRGRAAIQEGLEGGAGRPPRPAGLCPPEGPDRPGGRGPEPLPAGRQGASRRARRLQQPGRALCASGHVAAGGQGHAGGDSVAAQGREVSQQHRHRADAIGPSAGGLRASVHGA